MTPLFNRIALIGIGLIGSSIALAARRGGLAREIVVSTRTQATLARAEELGLGDRYCLDPVEAVKGADLVILCVPVGACGALAQAIAPVLEPGTIVSDVGSVKQAVIDQVIPHMPDDTHFIAAHPIAGTEHSGPDAGFAELFENRWCVLTPQEGCAREAVARLRAFWEGLGANVEEMDARRHDQVLAITSHLPHLIAYTLVGTAYDLEQETVSASEVIKFSAGGFRDSTRLASSDPTMWRDVFLNNKDAVLEMLGRFSEELSSLQKAIRWGKGDELFDLFTRTRAIRRDIIEAGQETAEPDFGRHIKDAGD